MDGGAISGRKNAISKGLIRHGVLGKGDLSAGLASMLVGGLVGPESGTEDEAPATFPTLFSSSLFLGSPPLNQVLSLDMPATSLPLTGLAFYGGGSLSSTPTADRAWALSHLWRQRNSPKWSAWAQRALHAAQVPHRGLIYYS